MKQLYLKADRMIQIQMLDQHLVYKEKIILYFRMN